MEIPMTPLRRILIPGSLILLVALFLCTQSMVAQQHTVTKVVVVAKPTIYNGPCPAEIQFIGTIFVSRHPVTVEYQWERSDGAKGERQKVVIRSAGQGVYDTWRLGAPKAHMAVWEKLHILAPTGMTSAPATVRINCR
jgi:hypothetical protein